MNDCPKCGVKREQGAIECYACGIIFAKYSYDVATVIDHKLFEKMQQQSNALSDRRQWFDWFLPILAFGVAPLFKMIFRKLSWALSMWTHEFGHAFAGWWGGVAATPFLGWTNFAPHRSWYVTLCFTFLLGALGYKSWQKKCHFLTLTFFCMFFVQLYFRFALSEYKLDFMFSYLGIGGEFWISTWLVMAYHHTFPKETHWEYLRYVALFVGALVFLNIFTLWWNISHGQADIPWGSLWGGDDHGDMNSLMLEHGWGPKRMITSYLRLGYICMMLMGLHYLLWGVKLFLKKDKPS
ncbi:MAG: hypothetical protein KDK51_01895 [Deltaproteobacteria bacterium]|nr:hypothetical protein [Deltaproteobacteria bacterium]